MPQLKSLFHSTRKLYQLYDKLPVLLLAVKPHEFLVKNIFLIFLIKKWCDITAYILF